MLPRLTALGFDVQALQHAEAILKADMPTALAELEDALASLEIPVAEIVMGGGGEAPSTQRMRNGLTAAGWAKRIMTVRKLVSNGEQEIETQSLSHEIDHVKVFGSKLVALEIEWNNKDPFFDRDLESFKRLHAEGVISVGIIVTRGRSLHEATRSLLHQFAAREGITGLADLQRFDYHPTARQRALIEGKAKRRGNFVDAWVDVFVSDKFGESTTHWRKLADRVSRGVGNPCPLLLIGIPSSVVKL
jgi:Restriction endonuclease BglII